MRVKGLAPLPMRLNTYDRVKQDTELQRIKSGKYKKIYVFTPSGPKPGGAAIGTLYEKDRTNPKSYHKPKKKWLGKTGDAVMGIYSKTFSSPQEIKDERGMNNEVLLEYVANNMYRVLGDGYFETSKMRLSYLPVMNKFLKNHALAKIYAYEKKISHSLRIMSKWVDGYHDLGELKVKDKDTIISFMDYIRKYKKPPKLVIEPEENQEIELEGIMGVLAAATSLADIDVLGRTGKNTGFIIERDEKGKMIRARVIKIDPGYAFSYDEIAKIKNEKKLKNPKDIVIETTHSIIIEWENLSEKQKEEFLEVKRQNLEIIKDEKILEYIFFREGKFDKSETEKMPKKMAVKLMENFIKHVKAQGVIYEKELQEYEPKREKIFRKEGNREYDRGDYDRALCHYEKDFEITLSKYKENHSEMGMSYNLIADVEIVRGQYLRAEEYALKGLEIREQTLPADHPDIAASYNNLGSVYYGQGNYDKAIEYYEKSLKIREKTLPADHPDIAASYNNLGIVYRRQGNYDKAIEYYEKSLKIREKTLPADHPDIAASYNNLGIVYRRQGNYDKAIEYYEKSLKIQEKTLPADHPSIAASYNNLGVVYKNKGNYDKAIEYYEKSLKIRKKTLPADHPDITASYNNLGLVYAGQGNYDKAIEYYEKALNIRVLKFGKNHPFTLRVKENLKELETFKKNRAAMLKEKTKKPTRKKKGCSVM